MPCDTKIMADLQEKRRLEKERSEVMENLKKGLVLGSVKIGRAADGTLGFLGWNDRAGICDPCAFEMLKNDPSFIRAKMAAVPVNKNQLKIGH